MRINHVLALRDYLYESSERPAGSALRGKPTADRRPHPLCVVQPLGRAQQWGIEQLRFATDEAAGACHLRHCGRQRRGSDRSHRPSDRQPAARGAVGVHQDQTRRSRYEHLQQGNGGSVGRYHQKAAESLAVIAQGLRQNTRKSNG